MKCWTPQACPCWSLPNNVKRQLYWTVLLNACSSLFKYCLTKYDACSGELAFEVAPCRILIRNVQRALVLLPLLPSVPGQYWPTFDVWGISYLGTTGREPAEACLAEPKARIAGIGRSTWYSLVITYRFLIDFFACDSCTNWIVSKCFNDSLMIPRATA